MQKEKLQVHSQFTCFKITCKSIEQIQPILRRALENASKIVATDEASFYGNDITSSQRMSNSGYISDIYIVKFDKSNSENIFKTLMSSFDDVTCLIAWELYDNNTLLLSCNHAHKFINVNKNKKAKKETPKNITERTIGVF